MYTHLKFKETVLMHEYLIIRGEKHLHLILRMNTSSREDKVVHTTQVSPPAGGVESATHLIPLLGTAR